MGTKIYKKYGDFGDRLKKLRKERFKTQDSFAEAIGKTVETVRNWEQGRALPEMETLFTISSLLGCDLDYLTGRLDQKTHGLQFIHDQTGLSEKAIIVLQESRYPEMISKLIEHPDFPRLINNLYQLSDKEVLNKLLSAMIINKITANLKGEILPQMDTGILEKQYSYTASTIFSGIVRDITDTEL